MSVILRFDAVIGLNQQHVQGVEETDSKNNSYGRCVGGKQMLQVRLIYDIYISCTKGVTREVVNIQLPYRNQKGQTDKQWSIKTLHKKTKD